MKLIMKNGGTFSADYVNFDHSDILSHLIKKAGALCDHYSSDLFISWKSVEEKMAEKQNFSAWFGFREMGVDHDTFLRARLNNPGCYGSKIYREIYKLAVSFVPYNSEWYDPTDGKIYAYLYKVSDAEALEILKEE